MITLLILAGFAALTWPVMFLAGQEVSTKKERAKTARLRHLEQMQGSPLLHRVTENDRIVNRPRITAAEAVGNYLTHAQCGGLWSKWTRHGIRVVDPITGEYLGTVEKNEHQERTCDQCGFTEKRKIS